MMLALLLAVSPASIELRWDAPPECPDATAFEARVAKYVEGSQPRADPVRVHGKIVREADAWRLQLATAIGDVEERRELIDGDCEGLTESAAMLVAIAVAPELAQSEETTIAPAPIVQSPPDDTTRSSDTKPTSRDVTSTPTLTQEPPLPPRPRPHASLRLLGGASLGWLPPGADVGLALAVFWRWLRLEIAGTYSPRRAIRFSDLREAGVDVSGWAVAAHVCAVLHPTRWLDTPLCGGAEAGQVIGRAVALIDGRTRAVPWLAGVLAPSLRFVVHSRVALWASPQLLVTIARPTLSLAGERDPIFEAAAAGGRFHAGIELRFW